MKIYAAFASWYLVVLFHAWPSVTLALERALVEVVIYEPSSGGDYKTYTYELEGTFSNAGAATSAEGDILEIHPLGLCNTSDDNDLYEYGWVGVVKLMPPDELNEPCFTLLEKVKRAMQRGATAIIFDTTDHPEAATELNAATTKIARPVVLIDGKDAKKLMNIMKNQKVSRARIQYSVAGYTPQIKWRQKQKESSLTRMALHALSRMETRKYHRDSSESSHTKEDNGNFSDAESTMSTQSDPISSKCVICLEKFEDGQDVRIVPCRHEFHKECVDPWLLSNYTCPLCMLNIVEKEGTTNKPRRARHWFIRRCGRCLSRADSFRSSISSIPQYMVEAPTQTYNSIQNVTTDANSNESHAHSSVVDLSCSEGHVESDSVSLKELRTNCENYASTSSIKSTCVSVQGYMSPYEEAKSYTHQVVVVAPITADMLDVSQEDIV